MAKTIALISDFGHNDAFVGIMKLVMKSISEDLSFIDLCHEVEPQNVLSGAYTLGTCAPFLPKGSVVLGVVDPGVGTDRQAVVVDCGDFTLVGPDNGLFSMAYEVAQPKRAFILENKEYFAAVISSTFHGRDIFAPTCAHLCAGIDASEFGSEMQVSDLHRFSEIGPLIKDDGIDCRVIHVDGFGNVSTNLSKATLESLGRELLGIEIQNVFAPFKHTFGDVAYGEPLCYFSSTGFLEFGIRNGNAGLDYKVKQRDTIRVKTKD